MNNNTHDSAYHYTGVIASADEIVLMRDAYRTPLIIVGRTLPEEPWQVVHRTALSRGLPDIKGYYGCDFRTGEFICLREAVGSTPDPIPSNQLGETGSE